MISVFRFEYPIFYQRCKDCDQIIQLFSDNTRVARALYLKVEALQYLGRKEEADNILDNANSFQPDGRNQVLELKINEGRL